MLRKAGGVGVTKIGVGVTEVATTTEGCRVSTTINVTEITTKAKKTENVTTATFVSYFMVRFSYSRLECFDVTTKVGKTYKKNLTIMSSKHQHQPSKDKKNKKDKPTKEVEEHHSSTDDAGLLEAYNFADTIQTDWENSAVPECTPLTLQWLDRINKLRVDPDDEIASETESVEDMDTIMERTQALHEVDRHEQLGVGAEVRGDEDQPQSDEHEDLEDFYMWPKFMDNIIYRLDHEVAVSKFLMNKPERKVYFGHRCSDRLPVVVIVGKEYDSRLRKDGVPREVRLMMHLRGQKNVAEILGWCPVGQRHFVLVIRHYQSADLIDASDRNLFIVSKMMESAITALKQVHDNKVVHRDVAKSNMLWNPLTDTIIIIDFDNSCFFRKHGYYRDVGRDRYDAPEKTEMLEVRRKLKEKLSESSKKRLPSSKIKKRMHAYTEKADIYSLGVLLWMLINGERHSPSPRKLKDWVAKIKAHNRHKKYAELDLLIRMLNFDPDRRITLLEALEHPFIRGRPAQPDSEYTNMKAYLFKKLNMDKECDALFADKRSNLNEEEEEKTVKLDHDVDTASTSSSNESAEQSTISDSETSHGEEEEDEEETADTRQLLDEEEDDRLTPDESKDNNENDVAPVTSPPKPLPTPSAALSAKTPFMFAIPAVKPVSAATQ